MRTTSCIAQHPTLTTLVPISNCSIHYNEAFVLQSYGEVWRKQRRFVSHEFNQSMVPGYYKLQEAEAITLVHNLLKDPASFISELKL